MHSTMRIAEVRRPERIIDLPKALAPGAAHRANVMARIIDRLRERRNP
jgi:hypothetical protein